MERNKKTVGIIGLGYVGLPLFINFSKKFNVIGFDKSKNKVELINKGISYLSHIDNSELKNIANNHESYSTTDFKELNNVDIIIICVPTPITKNREPDLSFVKSVMDDICKHMRKGQIISLESTTYPGTTEEIIMSRVINCGFKPGEDIYISYSPEREDPGNSFAMEDIPKIIGGITKECAKKTNELYSQVFNKTVLVDSVKIAELSKLLENIHRAVNIGMINEFKIICDAMHIDPFEVINAAATKPFGFVPYYPGPGWGGHCIPVDPFYLSWKAKEFGLSSRFIELSGELNYITQEWVISKISNVLNNIQKSIANSKILILGIAYKPNVDDARESPSLKIMSDLISKKADVDFSDPFFNEFPRTRKYNFEKTSINITPENIEKYDLVVVLTNHNQYDFNLIKKHARLIIDTRGVYTPDNNKIFRA